MLSQVRWCILAVMAVLVFVGRYRHTGGTKLNMSPQEIGQALCGSRFGKKDCGDTE